MSAPRYIETGAHLSPCERYRYTLDRVWSADLPRLVFVMLNPSTADHRQDDPTIRRCVGFAQAENYGSIRAVNLFALRATDPAILQHVPDPCGPDNNMTLAESCMNATVCCAWGRPKWNFVRERAECVVRLLDSVFASKVCLGKNIHGSPKHPLYLRKSAKLHPWPLQPGCV